MSIKLEQTNESGTFIVDLTTATNVTIKRLINNPLFTFSIPKTTFTDPDAPSGANQIVVNLSMFTDRHILTFDLTDGKGDGSNYRKLIMMASNGKKVYFTYDDEYMLVTIEELSLPTDAGKKDLLQGCSMSLVWRMDIGDL